MRTLNIAAFAAALFCAASVGAQPADWDHAQTVSVALSNFKFTPAALSFARGAPYRLHLTNSSSGGHDFAAKELFAASTIDPDDAAKIRNGEIGLKSGESADVRLIVNQAGSYPIRCTHFMHSSFGMTATATVR